MVAEQEKGRKEPNVRRKAREWEENRRRNGENRRTSGQ